jgi:hypothetical protein
VGRTLFLFGAALASVMSTAGCGEAITGLLTVEQPVSLVASGGTEAVPPGDYPLRVVDRGRTLTLQIERRTGDVVTVTLNARGAAGDPSPRRMPSAAAGQPVDVVLSRGASKHEVPLGSSRTSCRADVTETRCRTIAETDVATGQQTLREVCDYVQVDRPGSRTASSFRETSTRTISGLLLDPVSGLEVAHLTARSDRHRTYTVESACIASAVIR